MAGLDLQLHWVSTASAQGAEHCQLIVPLACKQPGHGMQAEAAEPGPDPIAAPMQDLHANGAVKGDPTKFSGKKSKAVAKKGAAKSQYATMLLNDIPKEQIPPFRWAASAQHVGTPKDWAGSRLSEPCSTGSNTLVGVSTGAGSSLGPSTSRAFALLAASACGQCPTLPPAADKTCRLAGKRSTGCPTSHHER